MPGLTRLVKTNVTDQKSRENCQQDHNQEDVYHRKDAVVIQASQQFQAYQDRLEEMEYLDLLVRLVQQERPASVVKKVIVVIVMSKDGNNAHGLPGMQKIMG